VVTVLFSKQLSGLVPLFIVIMVFGTGLGFLGLRSAFKTRKADISQELTKVKKVEGPIRISYGKGSDIYLHIKDRLGKLTRIPPMRLMKGYLCHVYRRARWEHLIIEEFPRNKRWNL